MKRISVVKFFDLENKNFLDLQNENKASLQLSVVLGSKRKMKMMIYVIIESVSLGPAVAERVEAQAPVLSGHNGRGFESRPSQLFFFSVTASLKRGLGGLPWSFRKRVVTCR